MNQGGAVKAMKSTKVVEQTLAKKNLEKKNESRNVL